MHHFQVRLDGKYCRYLLDLFLTESSLGQRIVWLYNIKEAGFVPERTS